MMSTCTTALRAYLILGLMICAPTLASADLTSMSFTGTLADANDVALATFTLSDPSSVFLQTWSYGGGMNAAGTAIPSGGFAMELALYSPSPDESLLLWLSNGLDLGCPPGNDTGAYCGDLAGNVFLSAGTYTLAIFAQGNQAPLSLPNSFGTSGQFWNFDSSADATPAYAVDVSVLQIPVPEPSSAVLLASAAALFLRKWRRMP
ncbi:MAG TPA: DVUA0089 family protein [Terriglobales bacterium]|nr:DVUA0089 family protein [Terriglobales bacterium]